MLGASSCGTTTIAAPGTVSTMPGVAAVATRTGTDWSANGFLTSASGRAQPATAPPGYGPPGGGFGKAKNTPTT